MSSAQNGHGFILGAANGEAAGRAAPAIGENVVMKTSVGFGAPLTLTVVALATAGSADTLAFTLEPEARMEKRGEMACMPPCVELMKRR